MRKTKIEEVDFKQMVEEISNDSIVLPDFQRGFVWKDKNKQKALIASVLTKLPIGTILLLEIDPGSYSCKKIGLKDIKPQIRETCKSVKALLDGQQRVTVLTAFFSNQLYKLAQEGELVSYTLRRRFFIKIPAFEAVAEKKDLFGWRTLIAPEKIREKQCPNHYSTSDMIEQIVFVDGNKYKGILDGDIGSVNRDRLLDVCTEHKIVADGYLIPLFYLLGAAKNQKSYLSRFEAVLKRIAEKYVNEIIEFLKKKESREIKLDYIKESFMEPAKSKEIEAEEKELLERVYQNLKTDIDKDSKEFRDEESDLFEHTKQVLESRIENWTREVSGFLVSCIEELELYKIEIEQSNIIRAIDIYENLNLGGKSLDVFDLLLARAATCPESINLLTAVKQYIEKDHSAEYEGFVRNCIKEQKNAYQSFMEERKEYSVSQYLGSWDTKENQLAPAYCEALMSTIGSLYHFASEDQGEIKFTLTNVERINTFSAQVTKSEYLLNQIPAIQIHNLVARAGKGLDRACLFLQLRCGIRKIGEIRYKLILVILAVIFSEKHFFYNEKIVNYLETWYWAIILSGGFNREQNQVFQSNMKELLRIIAKVDSGIGSPDDRPDYIVNISEKVFCNEQFANEEILLMENPYIKPEDIVTKTICQYYLSRTYQDILKEIPQKKYVPATISVFSEEHSKEGLQKHHLMPIGGLDVLRREAEKLIEDGTQGIVKQNKYQSPLNFLMISAQANQLISNNQLQYYIKECNNTTVQKIGIDIKENIDSNEEINEFLHARYKNLCGDLHHTFRTNLGIENLKEFYPKSKSTRMED